MARSCIFRRVQGKRNDNLPHQRRGQSMCFQSMPNKMQKKVKSHHDYQKSAQDKEKSEDGLQEIIIIRKITHSLRNGWFRRELSWNKVSSVIL